MAQANAGEAGERHQIDVGIEQGFRVDHLIGRRLDAPARRRNISPPTEQVGRNGGSDYCFFNSSLRRWNKGLSAICLPSQRCQRIARQGHLLQQGFQLQARFGQPAFALAQLQSGVEPGADAVTHQRQCFCALCQRAPRHDSLLIQTHQLEIRARHLACQQHTGGVGIRLCGIGAAQRRLQRRAILAEKVELPTGTELGRTAFSNAPCQWRRNRAVGGVPLARQVKLAIELRQTCGAGQITRCLRSGQPRLSQLQAGVVLQRLIDQTVERLVAKLAPPLRLQCRLASHLDQPGREAQRLRIAQAGLRCNARHVGAASHAAGDQARSDHARGRNQHHADGGAPHRHGGLSGYQRDFR